MSEPQLVEHFFRHEYGRLVAVLLRRVGAEHLDQVEDAVQVALVQALESWVLRGTPENPSAWLYRVAHNSLIGALRQQGNQQRLLDQFLAPVESEASAITTDDQQAQERGDEDMLCMLFVSCDKDLPLESSLVFALKTLCGFSVPEIAQRLLKTEANVYKRLSRARQRLGQHRELRDGLTAEHYSDRLPAVQQVIYALFSEGYLSSHPDSAIRAELCDEAIRLAKMLSEHPATQTPDSLALLALMHLHRARLSARCSDDGALLLLEEQDRQHWDKYRIAQGLQYLAASASGSSLSRYHAEAAIAAEHCLAPSFEQTRWDRIVENYELLNHVAPSALHQINQALALAERDNPAVGLAHLEAHEPPSWLQQSYQWAAVKADLLLRTGEAEQAKPYIQQALENAPSKAVRQLLNRRLQS